MCRKIERRLKFTKFYYKHRQLEFLIKTWENLKLEIPEYQQLTANSSFPKSSLKKQVFLAAMSYISRLSVILMFFAPSTYTYSIGGTRDPHTYISGFGRSWEKRINSKME